jgi:Kef-type K+ transport system membrane component KefB
VTLLTPELARLVLSLSLLLASAHVCGHVFARLRMPRVIGEVMGVFCSGAELRASARSTERRVIVLLTLFGTVLPFAAGLATLSAVDLSRFWGRAGNGTSFLLVFAIAIAVTSIPVISRILHDLGLMETSFAAIVLAAAVIEDVVLYVALAVAVGLVQSSTDEAFRSGSGSEDAARAAVGNPLLRLGLVRDRRSDPEARPIAVS